MSIQDSKPKRKRGCLAKIGIAALWVFGNIIGLGILSAVVSVQRESAQRAATASMTPVAATAPELDRPEPTQHRVQREAARRAATATAVQIAAATVTVEAANAKIEMAVNATLTAKAPIDTPTPSNTPLPTDTPATTETPLPKDTPTAMQLAQVTLPPAPYFYLASGEGGWPELTFALKRVDLWPVLPDGKQPINGLFVVLLGDLTSNEQASCIFKRNYELKIGSRVFKTPETNAVNTLQGIYKDIDYPRSALGVCVNKNETKQIFLWFDVADTDGPIALKLDGAGEIGIADSFEQVIIASGWSGFPTPTDTPLPTDTLTATNTPLPTDTPTVTNTSLPTNTPTDTPTITSTPLPTETPTLTPDPALMLMASAVTISYDDLFRNNERHIGKAVRYVGEVLEMQQRVCFLCDNPSYVLRIAVTEDKYGFWDDPIWVEYAGDKRFLDEDLVTFWGSVDGLETYTAVLGNTITIPKVTAVEIMLGDVANPRPVWQNGAFPAEGVVLKRTNLRSGPGTSYGMVGSRAPGDRVTIVGCNPACDWYELGDGQWIAAFVVGEVRPRAPAGAKPITVLSWNVESGGVDARVIGQRLADFQGVDLWGLVEVNSVQDAVLFEAAAAVGENSTFAKILSESGGGDRLLILYDRGRFEELGREELAYINIRESVRAPLLVHLRERTMGLEFLFMVNHLYREDDEGRHEQARLLNEWAARQSLPVIAVGDYNFDWDVYAGEGQHDEGFDRLVANGRFRWVRPAKLVTTQCTGWPCRFESVLDFVFTAGATQGWQATSEIVVAPGDFPDSERTSDHRPLLTRFQVGEAGPAAVAREPAATPTLGPAKPEPTATAVSTKASGPAKIRLVVIENQGTREIIGIRNEGAAPVDISGWRLDGSKGDDVCIIPAGVVVQPGQVYEVVTGDAQPGGFGYQCGEKSIWNNRGETIYLRGADGLVVQVGT